LHEKTHLKQLANQYIDSIQEQIYTIGNDLLKLPELGFKEFKTSGYVAAFLKNLNLAVETNVALTGVKSKLKGKSHPANVCIMGELDAVISPQHPFADKTTGAAHACGHHIQLANLLGCAMVFKNSGITGKRYKRAISSVKIKNIICKITCDFIVNFCNYTVSVLGMCSDEGFNILRIVFPI
jgi:hypothetical protein